MSKLKFTPDDNSSLPTKLLKEVGVPIAGATVSYEEAPSLKGLKLSINLEAKPSIGVFNSPDDIDTDGVLGVPKETEDDFGPLKLEPVFTLTNNDAWVKYRFSAKAAGSVGGSMSIADFKIDANKEVVFADYRHHDRDKKTSEAVIADLEKRIRTADNPDQLLKLGDKDALLYSVRGELSASVTLAWTDVFSWTVASLAQLLGPGQLLRVKVEPAASLLFKGAIRDDFKAIFTKASNSHVRVSIRKSDSREIGVTAKVGATVKWADPEQLESALKKIKEAVLAEARDSLTAILQKADLSELGEKERALAVGLMERLGIRGDAQTLGNLKKQWEKVEKRIDDTFKKISEAKVAAAFEYEYLRINTNEALLTVDLPQSAITSSVVSDLLLCDIQPVLDLTKQNPDILVTYLRQNTLLRHHAWGFSLGIGSISFGSKDVRELKRVIQKNAEGEQRLAYMGKRGYESNVSGNQENWVVDFKAQMPMFSQNPLTSDFDYGIYYQALWTEKKLSEDEFKRCLDYGVIWRILSAGNANELFERFRGKKTTISVGFKIDGQTFKEVLGKVSGEAGPTHGARALAKALPSMSAYDARRSVGLRESTYVPLWSSYLSNPSRGLRDYAREAADHIRKQGHLEDEMGLAHFESPEFPAQADVFRFARQIELHGNPASGDFRNIATNWTNFLGALRILNHICQPGQGEGHERIEKIFTSLSRFSSQWLYVRAAGAFLMDIVATNPEWLNTTERSFTIEDVDGKSTDVASGAVAG